MQVDKDLVYSVPDWRDNLRNFHLIENNRDKMALQPYPSLKALANFASLTYTDCTGELPLPEGWHLLTTARNNSWSNNYFGTAFWSPSEQQITIAHRGMNIGKAGTLLVGTKEIYLNNFTRHMGSAVTFAEELKKEILKTNHRFVLSFTGHSLGGWLAGVTTLTVKYLKRTGRGFCKIASSSEGIHAHTLALDSPGVEKILTKICYRYDIRYDRLMCTKKLDITTIFVAPNAINTIGFHTGEIFQVHTDCVAFTSDSEEPCLLSYVDTRGIDKFIQAFEDGNCFHVVKNWPQGWSETQKYHELEMFSNSHFLQPADEQISLASSSGSHQNPQSVEGNSVSVHSEESTLKYSTTPSLGNTCHLGVFFAEELSLLENWRIFQTYAIELTEIEQFVTTHNLERFNLPLFKIDNRKNTLACGSRVNLEELIRKTKQLIRWFPKEIMDAVNKQNESIKTAPLYLTGQAYLRTLPDILDCEDTLELNKFLENPKQRVLQIVTSDTKFEAARLNNILLHTEITPFNEMYLKDDNRHTSLSWNNLTDVAKKIDFEALNNKSATINNLLILELDSSTDNSLPNDAFKKLLTNLVECSLKKLVIILSSQNKNQLFKDFTLTVITKPSKVFELSDLTPDSREQILVRDVIALGEEIMSLERLLGNNSNTTSEQLSNLLNQSTSPILKNLATNNWSVEKFPNKLPKLSELDAFYSKGNMLVNETKLTSLLERSGANGPLLVIGDPERLSQDYWGEVAEAVRRRIFTTVEDGRDLFMEKCREESVRIIYWFHLSTEGFSLNEVFNKSVYIDRGFYSRVTIKSISEFIRYNGSKDLFIFKNAKDKKSLIHPFALSWEDENAFVSKDHFKVDSGDLKIEETFNEHYFEFMYIEERPSMVWQYSKGSLDSLRPFIAMDFTESTEEGLFSNKRKKLVIIADVPGMGKTTSLTRMSDFIRDSWVLKIDHKLLDSATAKLPPKLNLQAVTNCLIQTSGLPTDNDLLCNLLQHCLKTENSRRVCVFVDAFDEISDEKTKFKTVEFLRYLKTATKCKTVITTRRHTQQWLENDLVEFAAKLKNITKNEQEDYLVKFWLPYLALEHTEHGESEREILCKFARELREEVEGVLGEEVASFMGIPLQIRMLAEVFLQQAIQSVVSPEQKKKLPKITNLFVLYKQFFNVKETIFFGQKTNSSKLPSTFQSAMKEYAMKKHCVLAFKAIDPTFAVEYFTNVTFSDQELKEISCLGLIQSKTEDNFSFIHGTFQEYLCADFFVRWLREKKKSQEKNMLIKKEMRKFLLRPDYRTIRMFIETQLQTMHKLGDVLENHPMIYQHWLKDYQQLFNDHDKTPLHVAADEQNLHTFAILLSGPDSRISDQAYISFIAARDKTGRTALNIAWENGNTIMVNKLIDNVKGCSYELLLEIMLATFLNTGSNRNNGDGNSDSDSKSESEDNSDSDKDSNSDDNNKSELTNIKIYFQKNPQMTEVNRALNRVQQIRDDRLNPFIAAVRKDENVIVLGIWRNLKNDTERAYLLIAIDSRGNTAINLATRKEDHTLFKEFAKLGVCVSYDRDGQNPLHCAADQGHITIVSYLLNQTKKNYKHIDSTYNEDEEIILTKSSAINSQDKGGNTALMLAARGGYNEVVSKLLDSGADINSADNDGSSAVMLAAENNHPETVKILVDSREYIINSVNKYGNTALMLAAMKKSRKAMHALLEKGANINSANNDGDTALMYSALRGYYKEARILLEAKADTSHQNNIGETALSRAISYGHLKVVKLLLRKNPKILLQDNSWQVACSKAKDRGHKEGVILIHRHFDTTSFDSL